MYTRHEVIVIAPDGAMCVCPYVSNIEYAKFTVLSNCMYLIHLHVAGKFRGVKFSAAKSCTVLRTNFTHENYYDGSSS